MKPLDLNVSIQNSYEAARSESVRLDKPHIVSKLGNEDAQRDQVARDQSVVSVEPKLTSEDMFAADEYEHSDYTEKGGKNFKRKKKPDAEASEKPVPKDGEAEGESEPENKTDEENGKGFSTYA